MESNARSNSLASLTSRDWRLTRSVGAAVFYDAQVGMQECGGRIPQDSQAGHCWDKFNEQLRLFGGNVRACIESDPRDVPPGTRKALDKPLANGIACVCKNDWD